MWIIPLKLRRLLAYLKTNTLVCRTESICSNTGWPTMPWGLYISFKMKYDIICRTTLESDCSSGAAWLGDRDTSLSTQTFSSYVCCYMTDVSELQHSFNHRTYRFCSAGHMFARLSALHSACTSSSARKNVEFWKAVKTEGTLSAWNTFSLKQGLEVFTNISLMPELP